MVALDIFMLAIEGSTLAVVNEVSLAATVNE